MLETATGRRQCRAGELEKAVMMAELKEER